MAQCPQAGEFLLRLPLHLCHFDLFSTFPADYMFNIHSPALRCGMAPTPPQARLSPEWQLGFQFLNLICPALISMLLTWFVFIRIRNGRKRLERGLIQAPDSGPLWAPTSPVTSPLDSRPGMHNIYATLKVGFVCFFARSHALQAGNIRWVKRGSFFVVVTIKCNAPILFLASGTRCSRHIFPRHMPSPFMLSLPELFPVL
jgi:hypothetical protein